jgi:hypothetical protein
MALRGWRRRAKHNNVRADIDVGSESVKPRHQEQENGPMTLVHRSEAVLASPFTPIRDGLRG